MHSYTMGGRKERAVSLPDMSCLKVQEMQNIALEGRTFTVKQETFSCSSVQERSPTNKMGKTGSSSAMSSGRHVQPEKDKSQ